MTTILDRIVAQKRQELAEARRQVSETKLEERLASAPPLRSFFNALHQPGTVQVIAEVKKASPSAGVLRADFDPVAIARIYAQHGAACLSVLTDEPFFQGRLDYLTQIRQAVSLPLLRKDFLLERYQLLEARLAGADCVLLIAEILDDATLRHLLHETQQLGMDALVELHEAENLPRVLASGARLVGINNRDLRTFTTRLEHTLELARQIPPEICLVSESGIRTHEDLKHLARAGVSAVLVGESLMRADDIGAALQALLARPSSPLPR